MYSKGIAMETLTVCTYLTETPADQTRELSSDHKSRAQLVIVIEVGKAVISVPFQFYKFLIRKKNIYLSFWKISKIFTQLSRNLAKFGNKA